MKKGETTYTEEQRTWLIEHKYMKRKELVSEFNRVFNCNRTLSGLTSFMGKKLGIVNDKFWAEHAPYTDEQNDFLRDNFNVERHELTKMFNERFGTKKTYGTISKYMTVHFGLIVPQCGYTYSDEQIAWLEQFKDSGLPYSMIAEMFNEHFNLGEDEKKNKDQICHICRERLGFKQRVVSPREFTKEELAWIKENQYGILRTELAKRFNEHFGYTGDDVNPLRVTPNQLKGLCAYHGWKCGLAGTFGDDSRSDYVPWAKGMKDKNEFFKHYEDGYREELSEFTSKRFRKYHVGDIRVDSDGQKRIIMSETVGDNDKNHISYAKYVWEQAYGKGSVGEGKRFIYLDGDKSNCSLSNLRLVDVDVAMGLIGKNDLYGYGLVTDAAIEMIKVQKAVKKLKK